MLWSHSIATCGLWLLHSAALFWSPKKQTRPKCGPWPCVQVTVRTVDIRGRQERMRPEPLIRARGRMRLEDTERRQAEEKERETTTALS